MVVQLRHDHAINALVRRAYLPFNALKAPLYAFKAFLYAIETSLYAIETLLHG